MRRGFCDFGYLFGVTPEHRQQALALFSTYQDLDDNFIEDYYYELDLKKIYERRDELVLPEYLEERIAADIF